jgi:cadmium resistance protein CadD (predicted permease)
VVGQYPGIGAADLISFLVALTALAIAPDYVGFLGSAPIAIGTKNFLFMAAP